MSDVTWYSRLMVWVGAAVLLIESITARSYGPVTLISVLFLALGLLGLVGGLAYEARPLRPATVTAGAEEGVVALPPAPASAPASIGEEPDRSDEVELDLSAEASSADVEVASPPARPEPASVSTRRSVETFVVHEAGLALCPHCKQPLREKQLAATCFVCSSIHHASCWTDNGFHCAREGCSGFGGLEAPRPVETA